MKIRVVVIFCVILFLYGPGRTIGQEAQSTPNTPAGKFVFSEKLSEQEEQLKTNEEVLRFAESRKKLSTDRYRPVFHFCGPEGGIGDPNGLCYWNGNWHLFYLGSISSGNFRTLVRGHAVSPDLIHWRDLPVAFYSGPELSVYSGASLAEDNRVIFIYHGTGVGTMVAVADDPLLLNWEKLTGNAVIKSKSETGFAQPYSVFDPCIWKEDSIYYSLSANRLQQSPFGGLPAGNASLYRSKDLIHWEYMHQFVNGDRFSTVGDDYACPYLWPIGNKYIFYFYSHMSGGQYLLGDYDKSANIFNVTAGSGLAGIGPPSVSPDGKGGVIAVAINGLGGFLTIPRHVTMTGENEVGQEPAGDIESLRYDAKHIGATNLPANKEVVLKTISGDAMEISAEIYMKNSQMVELNVLRSPGKEEYTRIVVYKGKGTNGKGLRYISAPGTAVMPYDLLYLFTGGQPARDDLPARSLISIETEASSAAANANLYAPVILPFRLDEGETVKLRVFIDKSIVEVFVNGRQCVTGSVRPSRTDSKGVSIRSQGSEAQLISLDAWQMKGVGPA
jgi:beta-fructofuranosidase